MPRNEGQLRAEGAGASNSRLYPAVQLARGMERWSPFPPLLPCLLAAGLVAGSCWVGGGSPALSSLLFLLVALCAGLSWRYLALRVQREFVKPLAEACQVAEDLRCGQVKRRLPEIGGPGLRLLFRRLNETLATALERDRRSSAQLLSAEISLDRVHSVLQSLVEGVVVVDVVGEVVLSNAAAEGLFAASDDELCGKNIAMLLDGEIGAAVSEGLVEAEENSSGHACESGILWGDRYFDVLVVRVLSQRSGEDFGFVIVFIDVTSRFEVERAKNEFLSSVSHELRTPLTNICAYAEILDHVQPGNADWGDFCNIIIKEGHRLARLVEGVLEYSQIEADSVSWQMEEVDLVELLEVGTRLVQPVCQEQEITFQVETRSSTKIWADRSRMQKVLANLFDNAIKFTPGAGRIKVILDEEAGLARITVQDSGPGIDSDEREEIFHCFRQIGDPLTEKPSGAGLGLALCRRIMERHEGSLHCVDPDPDYGGARMVLRMPIRVVQSS